VQIVLICFELQTKEGRGIAGINNTVKPGKKEC